MDSKGASSGFEEETDEEECRTSLSKNLSVDPRMVADSPLSCSEPIIDDADEAAAGSSQPADGYSPNAASLACRSVVTIASVADSRWS
jgi:hypothetical protein